MAAPHRKQATYVTDDSEMQDVDLRRLKRSHVHDLIRGPPIAKIPRYSKANMTDMDGEADRTSHSGRGPSINDLPEEIVSQILHFLDLDPPSVTQEGLTPNVEALHVKNSPLKSSSCVSRTWRSISFPLLFKCLRVPLEDVFPMWIKDHRYHPLHEQKRRLSAYAIELIAPKNKTTGIELWHPSPAVAFYDFSAREGLGRLSTSLTIFTSRNVAEPGFLEDESCVNKEIKKFMTLAFWFHLFRRFDPDVVTVFAPPRLLGAMITDCRVDYTDAWAFNIECQRLQLRRKSIGARARLGMSSINAKHLEEGKTNYDIPSTSVPLHALPDHVQIDFQNWNPAITTAPTVAHRTQPRSLGLGFLIPNHTNPSALTLHPQTALPDLTTHKPWLHLDYHGGSCLPAYGTYHYFEKMPPCLLTHAPVLVTAFAHTLTSFSYKAVFPHHVHFRRIVSQILQLEALEYLAVQLAPTRDSGLLDDLEVVGRGAVKLGDCWMEVERCYADVVGILLVRGEEVTMEKLRRFVSWDCSVGALKGEVDALMEGQVGWVRDADVAWVSTELGPGLGDQD